MDLKPGNIPNGEIIIEQFIMDRFRDSGAEKAVVGISGGLDSAIVLSLMTRALGPDSISAYFLPHKDISGQDRDFAEESARSCGVVMNEADISPIVGSVPIRTEGMARGNLMARARMLFLYTYANVNNGMVIGTSNKSEILTGYFTKFGDGAADISPIGDLFKTQIRRMAADASVPKCIIERPPSAGLIEGQTDEGELGVPYPILDQILVGYLRSLKPKMIADNIDHTMVTVDQMERSGFEPPVDTILVKRILERIRMMRHKRSGMVIPKVQISTVGIDLRERW